MLEWWNGIHASLKNWWGHTRVGSTPTLGTNNIKGTAYLSAAHHKQAMPFIASQLRLSPATQ